MTSLIVVDVSQVINDDQWGKYRFITESKNDMKSLDNYFNSINVRHLCTQTTLKNFIYGWSWCHDLNESDIENIKLFFDNVKCVVIPKEYNTWSKACDQGYIGYIDHKYGIEKLLEG